MPEKTKSPRKLTDQQKLVKAFLFDYNKCIWSKEIKMANKLLKEHSFEFLISLEGRIKMPSLCWFYGKDGKRFLKEVKSYSTMTLQKESPKLEESPVAPEVQINKKPTSLKEFLNIFNKK